MRVLGLAGSLRRGSLNRRLLEAAAELAPSGVEVVVYDRLAEVPLFDEDLEQASGAGPEGVRRLRAAVVGADAVLIATPEYNSSIPGVLKNALDWASRPLAESPVLNKPVAVLSSSTGMFGGVWAAAETRKVLGALGARTLEDTVAVAKAHERLANGVDATLLDELRTVVDALGTAVRAREMARTAA